MPYNSLNIMVKIAKWIKRWLDLSHSEPWRKKDEKVFEANDS